MKSYVPNSETLITNAAAVLREVVLIPGSKRSPGGGNDNPFQYSCLRNLMDRGAWQAKATERERRRDFLACNLSM